MKKTVSRLAISVVLSSVSISLAAPCAMSASTWSVYTRQGDEAKARGDLAAAEFAYTKSLEEAQRAGALDTRLLDCLADLAVVFMKQKKYKEALPIFVKSLNIANRIYGSNHSTTAELQMCVGICNRELGDKSEAEIYFKKAVKSYESLQSGPSDLNVALSALGNLYEDEDRLSEAESVLRRAYNSNEKKYGFSDSRTTDAGVSLSYVLYRLEKFLEGESLLRKCLAALDKPPHTLQLTRALNQLGMLLQSKEEFGESAKSYARAIDIKKNDLKQFDSGLVTIIENYSTLLISECKFSEAEAHLNDAQRINDSIYGTNSRQSISTLLLLGDLFRQQEKFDKAQEIIAKAESIVASKSISESKEAVDVLKAKGNIMQRMGENATAEQLFRKAHFIEQKNAKQTNDIVRSVDNLSQVEQLRSNESVHESGVLSAAKVAPFPSPVPISIAAASQTVFQPALLSDGKNVKTESEVKSESHLGNKVYATHIVSGKNGSCAFSLENRETFPVTNIKYVLVAIDKQGQPVDSVERYFKSSSAESAGSILPGLAKAVKEIWHAESDVKPDRYDVRIISYDIVQ